MDPPEPLRRWARLLLAAVVTGEADPPPADRRWPAGLRWTRRIGIGRIPFALVSLALNALIGWIVLGTGVGVLAQRETPLWALGVAAVTAVPMVLRDRYPLGAWRWIAAVVVWTSVIGVWDVPGEVDATPFWPGEIFVALFCLYSVAVRCDRNITLAVFAISAGLPWILAPRSGTVATLLVGGMLLLGYNVRQRRRAQAEVVEQARVHQEARGVLEERQRIARELHDVVAHHMSVIAIQAEAAPYKVAKPQPELAESLADIRALAVEGLTELRRVLGVLRAAEGAETAPQPGLERTGELLASARAAGLQVRGVVSGRAVPVPAATALSAYRILQEALSNVMKHAPGAAVWITTAYGPDHLRISVRNGPGVRAGPLEASGGGHGMLGMRERAAMLGGELTAGPTDDGGFTVTVTLPLEPSSPRRPGP